MAKRILITGASGGIGEACALNLAQKGYDLALNGRNEAKLNDVAKRCLDAGAAEVQILKFDVADTATAQERIEADIEANGAYWGIVLNAGITRDNSFVWFEREDWQSVIDTNLGGFYNVLKPALMPMIRAKKGGRIVVMSSVSGIAGNRGQIACDRTCEPQDHGKRRGSRAHQNGDERRYKRSRKRANFGRDSARAHRRAERGGAFGGVFAKRKFRIYHKRGY